MSGNPRGRGQPRGRGNRGASPQAGNQGGGGRGFDRGGGRGFDRGGGGRGFDRGGGGGRGFDRGGGGGRGFDRGGRGGGVPRGRGAPGIFQENVPVQIPARLDDAQLKQLIAGFKAVKVKPEMPLRPGYGTVGTPIKLRANFFAMTLPKGPVYDYVVEILPQTDINKIKMRLFDLLEQSALCRPHLPYIAHDRSQRLVSAKKLPQPLDIQIPFYEEHERGPAKDAKVYMMSIKLDRELNTSELTSYMEGQARYHSYDPLPLLSALNLVTQHHANKTGFRIGRLVKKDGENAKERVGRSRYFFPASERLNLGPGIEAVQGFYASVRPAFKQLMVNVNVCMAAFIVPGNLADRLNEFRQESRGGMPTLPKGLSRNLKVKTLHLGHKKKVNAIGTTSARNTFFECEELAGPGGKVSVEQYFAKKYPNLKLKHAADLPVIDVGSRQRTIWIPAELCQIEPGNAFREKLSDRATAEMIKYAANPPNINAEFIVNRGFPAMGLAPVQQPTNGFGISIDTKMAEIPGRELPAPGLAYKVGRPRVQNGSWNILDVKFHRGANISSWWVLVVRDGRGTIQGPQDPQLEGLIDGFRKKLSSSGMAIPNTRPRLLPPAVLKTPEKIQIDRDTLKQALSGSAKPSFVLVLLENRDNYIYPAIKVLRLLDFSLFCCSPSLCHSVSGTWSWASHTIHMQLGKALGVPEKQDQYLSNVALKVNTKLGGMNHLLDEKAMRWLTKKSTMMVGIDVTHPGPGSREGTPSIAAVVASVDSSFVQFPASLRIQETKKEMLDELSDMLIERLQVYEKKNKTLPDRVIVYRDGVSEGQFDTVLEQELPQILNAFKKLSTKERKTAYKPQLSIIICGFYPTNSQYAAKNGNTRPGTIVDKGITGVFDFDFYLQAHAGLQGTVKATHYTVVYDEIGLSADDIQVGTHDVSYLYARATKAVSLIPAACYLNDFLDDKASTAGAGRRGKQDREEEAKRVFDAAKKAWGEGLHPDMRGSMFYI
ncbi:argonaute-like protein [Gymnopilus junonius]|uniref:Argonaute-like protein n=1 Tax=Gymnopilus junonius TaxID=109634 RepID=A0A9P5NUK2_GYMJU|nr:argonaute-like protein [Gymnopilus junonius]